MLILAAIAGVAASTVIYSLENVVDRKVTTKIQERRSSQLAAQQQQDVVAEAAPAPAQVYVPTAPEAPAPPSAREAALEAQLQQMQAAFAQLQAAQAQTAAATPAPAPTPTPTPAPAAEESLVKKGQVVAICDTATPAEGDLDTILPPDKRQGRVAKVNGDGTIKVNVSLGGKASAKSITVSEYDVIPV